jgi:RNA polymerase sigma-70 factor (ECF subfamily)
VSSGAVARSSTDDLRRLVELAQEGDREALEALYLLHFDRIYSYLHMSVGNRHDAEDLTTQTFLKMLEAIGASAGAPLRSRRGSSGSRTTSRWTTSARRGAGSRRRRCRSRRGSPSRRRRDGAAVDRAAEHARADREPLARQQQVLMLKFLFNFSNAEAATVLDKSEGAVKSLQHRALASLQKQLPPD